MEPVVLPWTPMDLEDELDMDESLSLSDEDVLMATRARSPEPVAKCRISLSTLWTGTPESSEGQSTEALGDGCQSTPSGSISRTTRLCSEGMDNDIACPSPPA